MQLLQDHTRDKLKNPKGQSIIITPRFGTISPWSSKATDIAHNSGLNEVVRIERGIVYYLDANSPLASSWLDKLAAVIHDRMTETIYFDLNKVDPFVMSHGQGKLTTVPLLTHGKKALIDIDSRLGLALSSDEIDYLFDAFIGLNRDPSDVEIMMFAQANSEHCRPKIFNAEFTIDGDTQAHSLFSMIRQTHAANPG